MSGCSKTEPGRRHKQPLAPLNPNSRVPNQRGALAPGGSSHINGFRSSISAVQAGDRVRRHVLPGTGQALSGPAAAQKNLQVLDRLLDQLMKIDLGVGHNIGLSADAHIGLGCWCLSAGCSESLAAAGGTNCRHTCGVSIRAACVAAFRGCMHAQIHMSPPACWRLPGNVFRRLQWPASKDRMQIRLFPPPCHRC